MRRTFARQPPYSPGSVQTPDDLRSPDCYVLHVLIVLLIVAVLLYSPTLRRGVGQFLTGGLFMIAMTLAFGAAGVIIAVLGSLAALYRPAPPRSGQTRH